MSGRILMTAAVPFRRILLRPWFLPVLRIGEQGTDEYFVDPPTNFDSQKLKSRTAGDFRARRSGEHFLYVNDAGLAIPGIHKIFYDNNKGTAVLVVKRAARQ
ncbi:MAG: hypothetical protein FJX29_01425 [Alphaproteobacteria bacterium]|nr:hypothetical protein [Alphaproteobacteria bacterium]